MALVCQVVTCTFEASQIEKAIIFGVLLSLTAHSAISLVFGPFEFYFAMLYIFYIEYFLVIWDRLQFYKKTWKVFDIAALLFSLTVYEWQHIFNGSYMGWRKF
jgi:hypothetical protein